MKTLSQITISQNDNQILTCEVYKEPNYILSFQRRNIRIHLWTRLYG